MISQESKTFFYKKIPPEKFCNKKVFLEILQNSQENACEWDLNKARNFINKETLEQVFSCELCKIFKNTFLTEHLQTTASLIEVAYLLFAVTRGIYSESFEHRMNTGKVLVLLFIIKNYL